MNKYKYSVMICGGYANGFITVEAENQDDAYDKAMDSFVERWVKTFPELDVDYNVELESVSIDKGAVISKINNARSLLPPGEILELNDDGCGEVRVLRYSESRGSAEFIDGASEVLWYTEDSDLDDDFNFNEFLDLVDAACI